MLVRSSLRFILCLALAISPLASFAQNRPVTIAAGPSLLGLKAEIETASPSELQKFRPSALKAAALKPGVATKIPVAPLLFYAVLAAMPLQQLWLKYDENPSAAKTQVDAMLSVAASAGVLAFWGGSASTEALLARLTTGHAGKVFRPLVGPLALTAGLLASKTVVHLLSDEKVGRCLRALDLSAPVCDEAYISLVESERFVQWGPEVASGVSAALIQAYLIEKPVLWAFNRAAPVVLRALNITWDMAGLVPHPIFKASVVALQIAIFVNLQEVLYKQVFESPITQAIAESEIDKLRTEVDRDTRAVLGLNANSESLRHFKIDVETLSRRELEWRSFLMRDMRQAQAGWSEYVEPFVSRYMSAYSFYAQLVHEMLDAQNNQEQLSPLDMRAEGQGVQPAQINAALEAAVKNLRSTKGTMPLAAINDLEQIVLDLKDAEPSLPLAEMASYQRLKNKWGTDFENSIGQSENTVQHFAHELKTKALQEAIELASRNLRTSSAASGLEDDSVFALILQKLHHEFSFRPGVLHLQALGAPGLLIDPRLAASYPGAMGSTVLNSAADYLLASMVCGPEADPAPNVKINIYKLAQLDWLSQWLYPNTAHKLKEPQLPMTEINKIYVQNVSAPTASLWGSDAKLGLVSERWGWSAEFRPPRIISDKTRDYCAEVPAGFVSQSLFAAGGAESATFALSKLWPKYSIHDGTWTVQGHKYAGFLELLRGQVRSDILNGPEGFESWWTANVLPSVRLAVQRFSEHYNALVKEKFAVPYGATGEVQLTGGTKLTMGIKASLLYEADTKIRLLNQLAGAELPAMKSWKQAFTAAVDLNHYGQPDLQRQAFEVLKKMADENDLDFDEATAAGAKTADKQSLKLNKENALLAMQVAHRLQNLFLEKAKKILTVGSVRSQAQEVLIAQLRELGAETDLYMNTIFAIQVVPNDKD